MTDPKTKPRKPKTRNDYELAGIALKGIQVLEVQIALAKKTLGKREAELAALVKGLTPGARKLLETSGHVKEIK